MFMLYTWISSLSFIGEGPGKDRFLVLFTVSFTSNYNNKKNTKARFILPANASCKANFTASQREREHVPIVASQKFASHLQEV